MHRSQLPLLLAWSTSPQMVFEPLQNLQALNPLQSLPIHQLASSFILLLIQLRSHGPSLLNTFFRTLNSSATLSFYSPSGKKPSLNGSNSPLALRQSTSGWVLMRKQHTKADQFHRVFMMTILGCLSTLPSKHAPVLSSTLQHASDLMCPPQTSDSPTSFLTLGLQPCLLFLREHWVCYTELSHPPTTKCSSPPPPSCSLAFSPSHQPKLVRPHGLRSIFSCPVRKCILSRVPSFSSSLSNGFLPKTFKYP